MNAYVRSSPSHTSLMYSSSRQSPYWMPVGPHDHAGLAGLTPHLAGS